MQLFMLTFLIGMLVKMVYMIALYNKVVWQWEHIAIIFLYALLLTLFNRTIFKTQEG